MEYKMIPSLEDARYSSAGEEKEPQGSHLPEPGGKGGPGTNQMFYSPCDIILHFIPACGFITLLSLLKKTPNKLVFFNGI